MTYELAKQLKEAGFPQGKCFWFYDHEQDNEPSLCNIDLHSERCLSFVRDADCPNLSELIEACGEDFQGLYVVDLNTVSSTCAKGYCATDGQKSVKGIGSTPEIAVANLWLELNKDEYEGASAEDILAIEGRI